MAKCPHCGKVLAISETYCWHCENDVSDIKEEDEKPKS